MTVVEEGFGKIITFYSYKGGTGRSMAMANVGYLLATSPLYEAERVLLIDWDLEAPGLQRFFRHDFSRAATGGMTGEGERESNPLRDAPGLIDFLTAVAEHYREMAPDEELPERLATTDRARELFASALARHPLSRYVQRAPRLAKLHLITAGSQRPDAPPEANYAARVRAFEWDRFYFRYGSFFTHFREHLMREFDYVLIDSRTGLTDTSGICTRVMPEKLVAVFVPNRQNIEGITGVIRQAAEYRRRSRDVRGLVAFPLASRIDASNQRLRQVWWHGGAVDGETIEGYQPVFERLCRQLYDLDECRLEEYFNATQVPHDSDYAFGEAIAARNGTSDRFSIGGACANLLERLVRLDAPWEELQDLRTQYEMARSTAEEQTRRAAQLEARLERSRRRAGWGAAAALAVAIPFAATLGLEQAGFHVGLTTLLLLGLVGIVVALVVMAYRGRRATERPPQ